MHRFLIIIEQELESQNYSAYAPDLPGCIATGRTREEVKQNMREAISMHLEGMLEDHETIPSGASEAEYVDVPEPGYAA